MSWWTCIACVCVLCSNAQAQFLQDSIRTDTISSQVHVTDDSSGIERFMTMAEVDTVSAGFHSTKSPGLAMLLSALVPGAGQAYNESYWKVPVVVGLGVYFGAIWLDNHRRYTDYRDRYKESLLTSPSGDGTLLRLRDFYRSQRDTFTWYFLIYYLVNVADAYVDASLYDFDVGETLSLRLIPAQGTGLTVQLRF